MAPGADEGERGGEKEGTGGSENQKADWGSGIVSAAGIGQILSSAATRGLEVISAFM